MKNVFFGVVLVTMGFSLFAGCKSKASASQCDQLLSHFATLVIREKYPDASDEAIKTEQAREHREAKDDEAFRNCPTEVSSEELACAMAATTSEKVLKCLE